MTTHDATWLEELLAYRAGELPLVRQLAVRWHLASCAACREELLIMTQISDQLRSSESETFGQDATLDPTLRDKILTSVATAAHEPATPEPAPRRAPYGREWAALGACAVVFVIAATTMLHSPLRQGFSTAASNINTSTDGSDTSNATTTSVAAPMSSSASTSNAATAGTSSAAAPSAAMGTASHNGPRSSMERSLAPGEDRKTLQDSKTFQYFDGHVKAFAQAQQRAVRASRKSSLAAMSAIPPGATSTDNMPSSLRRVHKEGRVTVAVEKVEDQSDAVTQMVKSAGGFVADNTLSTGGDGLKTATLSLKVPVKQFETIMGQIARLGEVKAKNIVGEDITEKFSDVEQADRILGSELSVKESQLKAALVLADTKRKRAIPVPWQQRAEVRELRIQAAQMRARLDLLKKISDLATIEAQIQEKPHLPKQTGFLGDINDNTASALDTFVVAARVPVNLLLWLLAYSPLWLPLLVAYFCLQRIYRRA